MWNDGDPFNLIVVYRWGRYTSHIYSIYLFQCIFIYKSENLKWSIADDWWDEIEQGSRMTNSWCSTLTHPLLLLTSHSTPIVPLPRVVSPTEVHHWGWTWAAVDEESPISRMWGCVSDLMSLPPRIPDYFYSEEKVAAFSIPVDIFVISLWLILFTSCWIFCHALFVFVTDSYFPTHFWSFLLDFDVFAGISTLLLCKFWWLLRSPFAFYFFCEGFLVAHCVNLAKGQSFGNLG